MFSDREVDGETLLDLTEGMLDSIWPNNWKRQTTFIRKLSELKQR